MRISELQDKWNSISPLTDGFLLASGDHPLSFHIGYYNGVKTFIVMNTGEIINLKSSKGINVACINTQLDEFSLRFSLLYESLEELFIKLCWDLIEYTKTSVDPVKEILTRYYNWLKLFQIDKVKLLSSNIQKGLIGELLFLKDCIENKGENNALTAWVGPEGSDQDFVFTDYWAEVKTVSISASEVGISSLQQLDRIDEGNLVVFFMDKTSSDGQNTISLYSIYTDILNIINSRDNIDVFLCKIAKYGLMEKNIQEYKENKYTLAECRSYKVTTKFPRLSKNNIPIEVTSARYGIDLATIEIYRI